MNNDNNWLVVVNNLSLVMLHKDTQMLFNEVTLRSCPLCEIYLFNNTEEAHYMAHQIYNCRFHVKSESQNDRPMSLPVSGNFILRPDENNLQLNPNHSLVAFNNSPGVAVNNNFAGVGVWGFTCMEGYGTFADLNNLINCMIKYAASYPYAAWFPTYEQAICFAKREYIARFYHRYDSKQEIPNIPNNYLPLGTIFIDSQYEEREKNRIESQWRQKMLSWGLLNGNY